jgi:molecular chaperone GrpE
MDSEKEDLTVTPQAKEGGENETVPANAGTAPATPAPDLAQAYEKAVAEKRDLYDRLLRKQAELDNFRKRTQKEKEELRHAAAEDLIRSLLPTLDAFERAFQQRQEGVPAPFYEGLELIYRELREVLSRAGLVPLETVGQLFDPYLHQAVETVDAPDRREHEIVAELQRGYKLKHRLLRPAIVKVAVGGNPEGKTPDEPSGKNRARGEE